MSNFEKGDICIYHYADGNGSLNLVEVTGDYANNISKIKCIQVLIDNSGNGWFDYLLRTGNEMIASNEYLYKIDILSRQQAENNRQKEELAELHSTVQELLENSSRRTEVYQYIKAQIVNVYSKKLNDVVENELCLTENEADYLCMKIDETAREVVGDE